MDSMSLPVIWLAVGTVLLLLELAVPGAVLGFLGLSAFVVAGLVYIDALDGVIATLTAWFIVSLACLIGLRGLVLRYLPQQIDRGSTDEDLDAFEKIVEVSETIPAEGEGRIYFRGSSWPARNFHKNRDLAKGTRVKLLIRDNLIWEVEAVDAQTPPEEPTT